MTRLLVALAILIGVAIATAGEASACDPGNWYDPDHGVCAPYPPYHPQPGLGPWNNNDPNWPDHRNSGY